MYLLCFDTRKDIKIGDEETLSRVQETDVLEKDWMTVSF